MKTKYILATGTQVRQEAFGLLFYTMSGPRLFFLPSGDQLSDRFFQGHQTLEEWCQAETDRRSISERRLKALSNALLRLKNKGVINEC